MNQIVTSQPHAPSRSSWKSDIPRAQRKLVWKFFVLRKIGYVRSQVESVAWNAPLVQFISLFLQQNYRKIILLLAKISSHAPQKKAFAIDEKQPAQKAFRENCIFLLYNNSHNFSITNITFDKIQMHICIYLWRLCGWSGGWKRRKRIPMLKLLGWGMSWTIFMQSEGFSFPKKKLIYLEMLGISSFLRMQIGKVLFPSLL